MNENVHKVMEAVAISVADAKAALEDLLAHEDAGVRREHVLRIQEIYANYSLPFPDTSAICSESDMQVASALSVLENITVAW